MNTTLVSQRVGRIAQGNLQNRTKSLIIPVARHVVVNLARPVRDKRATARRSSIPRAAAATAEACDCDHTPKPKVTNLQQALDELAKTGPERKVVVTQIAPAVRVAISETLGLPPGSVTQGQLVAGLRQIGFDYVFDTLFAADLTIMEEGAELLQRLEHHLAGTTPPDHERAPLPMFTSCCPGWVAMVEKSAPELIPYLSTCKSPQMMMGAVLKDFWAAQHGVTPQDVVAVSIMPCVRKQGEADRPWFAASGIEAVRDVDHVITTAELGKIFNERGIKLNELPESEFDNPLGLGSGGGLLFGTTGGVMEAALRTVYEVVSGQPMGRIVFEEVRGLEGLKEATVHVPVSDASPFAKYVAPGGDGIDLRIAVANGLGNAKKVIKGLAEGQAAGEPCKYDFIEVMACPGGCIGGGGQPRSADKQVLSKRQAAMYSGDERSTLRRSHENPYIQELYQKWLGSPNSHLAHERLHTHYVPGGVEAEK